MLIEEKRDLLIIKTETTIVSEIPQKPLPCAGNGF